jgi:homoserine O-acetyltransferase
MNDIVHSQKILLDCLKIKNFHAIIGNSVGAMLSLIWGILYPDTMKYLVLTSSSYKAYPANIANRVVQREVIQLDPEYQNGFYETNPINGLKIARKLGHFTYRNPADLNQKFLNNHKIAPNMPCEVENYLEYNATKFATQFDANCYLYLLTAMDLFDVTRDYEKPLEAFKKIQAKTLVISVDSDILFTPQQQAELFQCLQETGAHAHMIQHHSSYGHDTFLVETDVIGKYIVDFLST